MGRNETQSAVRRDVRGLLAYILGKRFLQKGQAADSRQFFETALKGAGSDLVLEPLARMELEKIQEKKQ